MRRIALMLGSVMASAVAVRAQTSAQGGATPSPSARTPVAVLQVSYYAQPGRADEVWATRQRASDLLESLGLPRGRVMRRVGGTGDDPDVMWECEYPNAAAIELALKTAAANSEFEQVRKHMASLIRKAELAKWEVTESRREKP